MYVVTHMIVYCYSDTFCCCCCGDISAFDGSGDW